jgi:TRAP transporter TAXI family solute receptor
VRIATSSDGGLYSRVGDSLKPILEEQLGRPVELVHTRGSVENRRLLMSGDVDLAILQDGSIDSRGLAVIAPLYHEIMHVLVRKGSGIESIEQFKGRSVAIGRLDSGMHESALTLLRHYGLSPLDLRESDRYFGDLLTDPGLEAAIVTTGFLNGDLQRVMDSRQFELLPIRDAESMTIHHPYLSLKTIPTGVFEGHPPVPENPVSSVATIAFLGTRESASDELVRRALTVLYERDLRQQIPTLIPLAEARATTMGNLHRATRSYYDPFGGVELLSNLLESLSAVKELLFAFCAGLYLLWDRWRRAREREERQVVRVMKERLDQFLEESVRLERAQMESDDPLRLRQYLDEVTRLKLRAIDELTHEDLRGDRMFSIFLLQCGDLAAKIQAKLQHVGNYSSEV